MNLAELTEYQLMLSLFEVILDSKDSVRWNEGRNLGLTKKKSAYLVNVQKLTGSYPKGKVV